MKKMLMVFMLVISTCVNASDWSPVEREFLRNSIHSDFYPDEKVKVIEVGNSGQLGKLMALRFLEWVKDNPNGVVALPTGKTPELFIEYLKYLKGHWNDANVQNDLARHGITGTMPDTSNLKFVQLDEFYAMDPNHAYSFTNYVKRYYIGILGIRPENVLLIDIANKGILGEKGTETVFPGGKVDLTLLSRAPIDEQEEWQKQALEEAQAFCRQYEAKIREWGGIDFFIGGIGTDGHIAFNMPDTSFQSRTHLAKLTYTVAAAAAVSLGGIEHARDKVVITIGLDTITAKKDGTFIIMAAGESKAPAVKAAVEGKKEESMPASIFQGNEGARFYVTSGAAIMLTDRKLEDTETMAVTDELIDDVIIEIALQKKKAIRNLTASDIKHHIRGGALVRRTGKSPFALKDETQKRLKERVEMGLVPPADKRILHTGPHHDDVLLSYYGLLPKILGHNSNLFIYLTSGFNAVTDKYMTRILKTVAEIPLESYDAMESPYALLLTRMLRMAQQNDQAALDRYEGMLLLRHIGILWKLNSLEEAQQKAKWLLNEYFAAKKPGEKDMKEVQILKGAMRESEEDRHMTVHGVPIRDVLHMRASFYTGDYFTPPPSIEKDAQPVLELCQQFKPDVVTVALDPEGTGPDTHYKVLQVVAQALRMEPELKPRVWGYRNVWHRFPIAEANMIVPVNEKELEQLHQSFMICYSTQKDASFPALDHDGPFSELSIAIQKDQLAKMKLLLGDEFFLNHESELLREAAGLLFIKDMSKEEFMNQAQELKNRVEFS